MTLNFIIAWNRYFVKSIFWPFGQKSSIQILPIFASLLASDRYAFPIQMIIHNTLEKHSHFFWFCWIRPRLYHLTLGIPLAILKWWSPISSSPRISSARSMISSSISFGENLSSQMGVAGTNRTLTIAFSDVWAWCNKVLIQYANSLSGALDCLALEYFK